MAKSKELLGAMIPFVEAKHVGPKQRPTAIVIRSSFTTGDSGAAHAIAQAWHNPYNQMDSCHYVIDEHQTLRCLPDNRTSRSMYTEHLNKNAIVINICHDPPIEPTPRVLQKTARQVARLCRLYRIKRRLLDKEAQIHWVDRPWKRRGGIILAVYGDFPTNKFLSSLEDEYKRFK